MVLVGAFAVRAVLVFSGGQYYWPDERLYRFSQQAAEAILAADGARLVDALSCPEHTSFVALGVVPALVEQVRGASSRIPALFFSLCSVVSLWLVRQIASRPARVSGGGAARCHVARRCQHLDLLQSSPARL